MSKCVISVVNTSQYTPHHISIHDCMRTLPTALILLGMAATFAQAGIYADKYDEAYKIASAMTTDQKIGQAMQADFQAFQNGDFTDAAKAEKYFLGSLLVGGDGTPDLQGNMRIIPGNEYDSRKLYATSTMDKWQALSTRFNFSIKVTTKEGRNYDIRPLLGTDAVHGNQHISGTVLFPHNVGLACTHNPDNFYNAGYWTRDGVKQSGFNYAFAPTVAVSHNPQWGRFYETVGQEEDFIREFARSYTLGLQGSPGSPSGVLGSAKHFYADGATLYGADEGDAVVGSFRSFVRHNTQGYVGSIAAEIGSVMVSYSAINMLPNSVSPAIRTILREKLGFDGLVISDYDELEKARGQRLPTNLFTISRIPESLAEMVNAGMDMIMIPGWRGEQAVTDVYEGFKTALQEGIISMDRLNDAVARILAVKLALGSATLSTSLNVQPQNTQQEVHATTEQADSLTAVRESLVLLKNQNKALPFDTSKLEYVVLVGERVIQIRGVTRQIFRNFDDIGLQNGGWSLRWQGFEGNSQWEDSNKQSSKASSILDALKKLPSSKAELLSAEYSSMFDMAKMEESRNKFVSNLQSIRSKMNKENTVILGVLGQPPYAEFKGDVGVPYCLPDSPLGGCMYYFVNNQYLLPQQRTTLDLAYDPYDERVINTIRQQDKDIPLVTVLFSGRPMLINAAIEQSQAVVAAWLPGTSGGQGVVDALSGQYKFRPGGQTDRRNTLAFDWPSDAESTKEFPVYEADGEVPRIANRLYEVGWGLSTA